MIKLVDRYVMSSILATSMLIFFIFLALMFLISLAAEMPLLGETYNFWYAIEYVILRMPLQMYVMFPTIALMGALLGLGSLASYSELTVMRASGMSIFRLAFSVFLSAILLIGLAMLGGEYFAPKLADQAEKTKLYLKNNGQILSTENGIWLRQNQAFIHIGTSYGRQRLSDITRYELNSDFKLARIRHADSAVLEKGEWLMQNIVSSEVNSEKVVVSSEPTAKWEMNINLSDMDILPEQLSVVQLYKQAELRANNGINAGSFWIAFWSRLFQPLITLMMVFLAIPFAFGSLRSATAGLRLLAGVAMGLSFYLFNRFFGPFVLAYQLPTISVALVPIVIFTGVLLILMMRKQ